MSRATGVASLVRARRFAAAVLAVPLLLLGAMSLAHAATDAPEEMKLPRPGMRRPSTTPMEKEMHALQARVQRLKSEMDAIAGSTDVSERKRLMTVHLANLRQTMTQFHAMEVQMVDWFLKGRIVFDGDLRNRQQLLAEQTVMLLQMLEQTMQAAAGACPEAK